MKIHNLLYVQNKFQCRIYQLERLENFHTNPCESDWIDVGDTEFNRRVGEIFQSVKGDEEQKKELIESKEAEKDAHNFPFFSLRKLR